MAQEGPLVIRPVRTQSKLPEAYSVPPPVLPHHRGGEVVLLQFERVIV